MIGRLFNHVKCCMLEFPVSQRTSLLKQLERVTLVILFAQVPEEVKTVVRSMLRGDAAGRFAQRAGFMKRWLKRSLELKNEEHELHDRLPPHLKAILSGKRLLLWREILVDLGYPDVAVIDDIISGFSLTGWAPRTGVFRPDVRRIFQLADNTFSLACQTVLAIC